MVGRAGESWGGHELGRIRLRATLCDLGARLEIQGVRLAPCCAAMAPEPPPTHLPVPRARSLQRLQADLERKRGTGVPVGINVHGPYLREP